MTDPVCSPPASNCKQAVDRTTIGRHLLSDQSDPFNRAPLILDMVEPHQELRDRVRMWM